MPATGTKSGSSKKTVDHPPYEAMIKAAILSLKERKGSSRPAIKKYILANYKVTSGAHFDTQIAAAIKRGAAKNVFALPRGLSGTVKLVKPEKKTTAEKKDKETKTGDKKSTAESKTSSTKKKASPTKKAPKSAAAKKAALAKKQPSKQKTATKQNVKAPRKKSTSSTGTTTTTTKKATATRKKATAKA